MHKEKKEQWREEIILKIVENQEENQWGRDLNQEDKRNVVTVGNQCIKKKDCWTQKKNEGDKQEGNKEENVVSNKSEKDALVLSLESVDDSWILDFGGSFHATPHRGYFIDYVQGNFRICVFGG